MKSINNKPLYSRWRRYAESTKDSRKSFLMSLFSIFYECLPFLYAKLLGGREGATSQDITYNEGQWRPNTLCILKAQRNNLFVCILHKQDN